ncbi:hypothetical protein N7495_000398 [Penicillium taxi]|uniref:uncharacterized protein n=1 Tax=Penicillium taxi TaxID=168475 RepID=UPI0025459511|nr:uncharacterized protein N7495_000398 [Penicillium taxi]KAJ5907716.1 hypothetical protein N7495_000398 [Penicillium taxi]
MSRRTLVLDGLWYTLCPSFSPSTLSRPPISLKSTRQNRKLCLFPGIATATRKCYSTNTSGTGRVITPGDHLQSTNSHNGKPASTESEYIPDEHPENLLRHTSDRTTSTPPEASIFFKMRTHNNSERKVPVHDTRRFYEYPSSDLEHMLRNKPGALYRTMSILRALIEDHHIQPQAFHYKSLILANSDSIKGSPEMVRALLQEMEEEKITVDSGILHVVLQVLAVHPDYLLRQEILRSIRDRWFTLSPDGWHFVVAGLLREHQFELALDHVALMERKLIPVKNWLHSMIVYNLCDFEEFDEVYRLMQARVEQGYDMTPELWGHVLTAASKSRHYELTLYIWQRMIYLEYIQPSEDVCKNALATASRAGDIELAQNIFKYIAKKGTQMDALSHEQLILAYLDNADLYSTMEVMSTMHEAGCSPTDSLVESIITHMIKEKTDPREVWQILKALKNSKRKIPIDSARVVIEFCERVVKDDPSIAWDAMVFHKELYSICPNSADTRIYNTLMQICRRAGNRAPAMFLLKEMVSLRVVPDATTFEILILMCLEARNYKSAYMYFQDLLKRDGSLRQKAREEIRQLCAQSVHEFAMQLQYNPGIGDDEIPIDSSTSTRKLTENSSIESTHSIDLIDQVKEEDFTYWVPAAVRRKRLSDEERKAWNKKRRQSKRKYQALARIKAEKADKDTTSS